MDGRRVDRAGLERAVASALGAADVPEIHAATAARVIVEADACGRPSHGVSRLPTYLAGLRSGAIRPDATVDV